MLMNILTSVITALLELMKQIVVKLLALIFDILKGVINGLPPILKLLLVVGFLMWIWPILQGVLRFLTNLWPL